MKEKLQDTAVIQQVLSGQQQAYSILVERYGHLVFTVAMRYVNNREVAEELAQDSFVKAYRFLADYKQTGKFSTWLYSIANNTCLSYLRKQQNDTISLEDHHADYIGGKTPGDAEQRSMKAVLAEAIKKLPAQDAELITLYYLAEQSQEEISVIMSMEVNNVKVRLFRARQKLKEIIEKQYGNEFAL